MNAHPSFPAPFTDGHGPCIGPAPALGLSRRRFLNRFGIERELAQGELVHLPLRPLITSHLGVYVRVERALPPALDAFVRVAAQEIERRQAEEG